MLTGPVSILIPHDSWLHLTVVLLVGEGPHKPALIGHAGPVSRFVLTLLSSQVPSRRVIASFNTLASRRAAVIFQRLGSPLTALHRVPPFN